MSTRRKFKNRVFTKIDKYAFADVRRRYGLSAQATLVLESMVKLADHRSRIYSGYITDLHDYTGISRPALRSTLNELEEKFLIVTLPSPPRDRQKYWSVATVYDEFVVPPDTENLGSDDQPVTSSRPSDVHAVEQSLHSTSDDAQFGGLEALEERGSRPAVGETASEHLRAIYQRHCSSWPHIQKHLDQAISDFGLAPGSDWSSEAVGMNLKVALEAAFNQVSQSFDVF